MDCHSFYLPEELAALSLFDDNMAASIKEEIAETIRVNGDENIKAPQKKVRIAFTNMKTTSLFESIPSLSEMLKNRDLSSL